MRPILILFLLFHTHGSATAQRPLQYTLWGDAAANVQLAKSSLYFLGAGGRLEVSRPLARARHHLLLAAGYTHFFRKSSGAFTADAVRVTAGYRYQSRRAFNAHAAAGAQYLREDLRITIGERALRESLVRLMPAAAVGLGLRLGRHAGVQVEYRPALRIEPTGNRLTNHLAASVGYTF